MPAIGRGLLLQFSQHILHYYCRKCNVEGATMPCNNLFLPHHQNNNTPAQTAIIPLSVAAIVFCHVSFTAPVIIAIEIIRKEAPCNPHDMLIKYSISYSFSKCLSNLLPRSKLTHPNSGPQRLTLNSSGVSLIALLCGWSHSRHEISQ